MKITEEDRKMAATAKMVRDGGMSAVDSKGKRLPLRFWAALARVETVSK